MSAYTVAGRLPTGEPVRISVDGTWIVAVRAAVDDDTADLPYVAPGLVDLQVNGFAGYDVNGAEPGAETVRDLTRTLWRHGVTGWCPTVVTASEAQTIERISAIAAAVGADDASRSSVLGIHLEGPHISPVEGARGVHPREWIRRPDPAELARWAAAAEGLLAVVTLSPEWDEAADYVRCCVARDVIAAIGHTVAAPKAIADCVTAGAALSTHLGNGAPAMLPRHPNMLWAQLADDRLSASFIADGHHLPAATLKSMVRAKTVARSVLVSDSTALGGLPPGEYDTPVGGRVRVARDGRLSHVGTPYLAGAAATLAHGVAGAVRFAEVSLADALRMATANPAGVLRDRAGDRGRLMPGARADLIRFDWSPAATTLQIRDVMVAGHLVVADGEPTAAGRPY